MKIGEFKKEIEKQELKGVSDIDFLHEFTDLIAEKMIDDFILNFNQQKKNETK